MSKKTKAEKAALREEKTRAFFKKYIDIDPNDQPKPKAQTNKKNTVQKHVTQNHPKIYGISKGQLVTIWVFGVILWLGDAFYVLIESGSYGGESVGFALFLLVLIPFSIIFYSVGWKRYH